MGGEPPAGSGAVVPVCRSDRADAGQGGPRRGPEGTSRGGHSWGPLAALLSPEMGRCSGSWALPSPAPWYSGRGGDGVLGARPPPGPHHTGGSHSVYREDNSSVPAEIPSCSITEENVLSVSMSTWPTTQGGEGLLSVYTGLGPRSQPGAWIPRDGRPGMPPGRGTPGSRVRPFTQKHPGLGFMLCYCCLQILDIFRMWPRCDFAPGPVGKEPCVPPTSLL